MPRRHWGLRNAITPVLFCNKSRKRFALLVSVSQRATPWTTPYRFALGHLPLDSFWYKTRSGNFSTADPETTFVDSNTSRSNWNRCLPKLFPPQPCRIRLARFLASSGKLGLSSRFGYVHRATTWSAKKTQIGHFSGNSKLLILLLAFFGN